MLQAEEKEFLKIAKPLQYLEANELDMLMKYSQVIRFQTGEKLVQQGKMNIAMLIIISGTATVSAHILGRGLMQLITLEPGNFVGETSLIQENVANITVTANTTVVCLKVSRIYLDMLSTFFPEMKFRIIKAISEVVYVRTNLIRERIEELGEKINIIPTSTTFRDILHSFMSSQIMNFKKAKINKDELSQFIFFQQFSIKEQQILLEKTRIRKASARTHLIRSNENKSSFYIILFGAVQANIIIKNKPIKLTILGQNSFFCNISYIGKEPSFITYDARENVILLEITLDAFEDFSKNNRIIFFKLYNMICKFLITLERVAGRLFLRLNSEFYNR